MTHYISKNTALLLIDIQNDFCKGGALEVANGDSVVEVANELMPMFQGRIFASQDSHPYAHKSFASSHQGKKIGDIIPLGTSQQFLWPDHCVKETHGESFHSALKTENINFIVKKGENTYIDSYSAFFDNDHQTATTLHQLLQKMQINTLYIMGLATDYCVKYSVIDALKLGYQVFVVKDGCRAVNIHTEDEVNAYEEMKSSGANIISSKQLLTKPIIQSMLDIDFYKFTMAQVAFHKYPQSIGEYAFKCRTPQIDFTPIIDQIKFETHRLQGMTFSEHELAYLDQLNIFKGDFLNFLKTFVLKTEDIQFSLEKNNLKIRFKGKIVEKIWLETMILAIVSEVYRRHTFGELDQVAKNKLFAGLNLLEKAARPIHLVDFGTRRRASYEWQEKVVSILKQSLFSNIKFHGTSNVHLAKNLDTNPQGTMAHEFFQMMQVWGSELAHCQLEALQVWHNEYQDSLATALTDIFGIKPFLNDISPQMLHAYKGFRHDSGDPLEWANLMLKHFARFGIDASQKTLIFSDSLNFEKINQIALHLKDCPAQLIFGVGTKLTHNISDIYKPLSIVLKLVSVDDQPTAKVSDSQGKGMCEDESYIDQVKKMIFNKSQNYELFMGKNRFDSMEKIKTRIVEWIKQQAALAQAHSLIIGVSGGIDSAVVLALCKLTQLPVYPVLLPCHSNPEHVTRAKELCKHLHFNYTHIDLAQAFHTIIDQIDSEKIDTLQQKRFCFGALRSCLRTPALDFVAKIHHGLIVGTGNKDEDGIIRYFQKRGDGCVDISPIADLHKREVFDLAAHLQLPQEILNAIPSADLWGEEDQSDEAELGLKYADVEYVSRLCDSLGIHPKYEDFFTYKSQHQLNDALMPFHTNVIEKVMQLEKQSRHKENINIPICILTDFLT